MDSRGNAMLPSPFLDDILAVVPLEESRPQVSAVIPELASCMEREELLNAAAARSPAALSALAGKPPLAESAARIAAVARIEQGREAFFAAGSGAADAGLSSSFTGRLSRPDIVAELRDRFSTPPGNSFAPTHLEEYGCCPFRYFLKRLVGIAAVEKPGAELEAKDEGSLVHELLHLFFQRLADEGRLPLRDIGAARVTLRETAAELFARWEAERHTGEPLLWEIGKERLLAILERMVEIEGAEPTGFVPRLFEHPVPGLEVEDSDGSRISLTGKIDRADTAEGGRLRVVDYKLAGNRQKYRNLLKKESLGVTSFQMPVYLLAALRELGAEKMGGSDRLSALYWLLARLDPLAADFSDEGKEDFSGFFATATDERERLGDDNFLNRLCKTVRAMKNGEFSIIPRECEFCNFGSVCRYVETQITEEEK
ncbi:MAG TPA: PD-(D/E)XK nuclease family protein, partial [Geobacteraceae bacterium]